MGNTPGKCPNCGAQTYELHAGLIMALRINPEPKPEVPIPIYCPKCCPDCVEARERAEKLDISFVNPHQRFDVV